MHLKSCIASALVSISVATAASLVDADFQARFKQGFRLIKTSPTDAGAWVTDEDKIANYTGKCVHFVDITDIKDPEVLRVFSGQKDNSRVAAVAAITYPAVSHQTEANGLIAQLNTSGPQTWLKALSDFYNRYYKSSYGTQSATYLFNTVKSLSAPNPRITVSQFSHSYAQPSVIARIPGTSPNLIVVSAHFDSTGGSSTARGPGAVDNASGCVVLMETLRVLATTKYAPRNTFEFHFYSGEEAGLLGSGDIFRSYKSSNKPILAVVNTDMAGYSPSGKISSYNDYSDAGLLAYVRRIITAYLGSYTTDTCGYGCSDHASAYSNGFPAAYVCDEPDRTSTPYIHSPNDAYSTVSFATVLRHAKFTMAFLVEANYI
ncbi:MAG: hypothetical protein LQ339_008115 [Xanthoria mediterranea]|nr:MAG: hypothetical protein LQ339_008115 [Xanthoria mediterranea]